jgi:DNA-binding transcriptional MerR regulator
MPDERNRKYSLERLSELTDVQERTIRAYIAQGLIPSPVGKGRAAHYTEVHRKRLKVIKQLRDRYGLPLEQIRQYLMTAGENEDVQIIPVSLASPVLLSRTESGTTEYKDNASASKRQISLKDGECNDATPELFGPRSNADRGAEMRGDSRLEQLVGALQQLAGLRSRDRGRRSEACHLLEITPDINLLVKGQYAPREVALFEDLADGLRVALTRGLVLSQQEDDE